ncbi:hypothetical protein [Campylobacter sp. MIT 97-5078]|uniref:hypothetical protein n=1 Tax=Campylobacter sp. MIT 97-5078 TaxID=1548153 RepID=UPI000513D80C|nr:hypothetical protein [Campylobacter sp. MIT 97-5078]KGI55922.1 hypothetical protein LR59_09835 [Campylobacter sp. MIT 97-5078]TQR27635.1 hypothetical protein DMB91_03320 [Campylobacter sp. MIT 97-5078]
MNSGLLGFIIVFVMLIIVFVIVVLVMMNKKNLKTSTTASKTSPKALNLEQMLSNLSNPNLSSSELHELILIFINTQKLPFKSGENLSSDAKKKLDFVTTVAMHPNSTAKNISFLNRELAKRYSSYKKEIDAYEQMGLAKRKICENKG